MEELLGRRFCIFILEAIFIWRTQPEKSREYSYNLQSVITNVNRQIYSCNQQAIGDYRRREDLSVNQPDPLSGFIGLC
jgi:hypothetical protein